MLREKEFELDIPARDKNTIKLRYVKEDLSDIYTKYKIKYRAGLNMNVRNNLS